MGRSPHPSHPYFDSWRAPSSNSGRRRWKEKCRALHWGRMDGPAPPQTHDSDRADRRQARESARHHAGRSASTSSRRLWICRFHRPRKGRAAQAPRRSPRKQYSDLREPRRSRQSIAKAAHQKSDSTCGRNRPSSTRRHSPGPCRTRSAGSARPPRRASALREMARSSASAFPGRCSWASAALRSRTPPSG